MQLPGMSGCQSFLNGMHNSIEAIEVEIPKAETDAIEMYKILDRWW
jgi:hypothetical protein